MRKKRIGSVKKEAVVEKIISIPPKYGRKESDIEVEQVESNNTNVSDILNKDNRVLFNEPVPVFPVFSPPSIQNSESSHSAAMATSSK